MAEYFDDDFSGEEEFVGEMPETFKNFSSGEDFSSGEESAGEMPETFKDFTEPLPWEEDIANIPWSVGNNRRATTAYVEPSRHRFEKPVDPVVQTIRLELIRERMQVIRDTFGQLPASAMAIFYEEPSHDKIMERHMKQEMERTRSRMSSIQKGITEHVEQAPAHVVLPKLTPKQMEIKEQLINERMATIDEEPTFEMIVEREKQLAKKPASKPKSKKSHKKFQRFVL